MTESVFYTLAAESLSKECNRLNEFTASLDKNPAEKKARIAEYKCAKYRQASVGQIRNTLFYGNEVLQRPARHLIIEEHLNNHPDYLELCSRTSIEEKVDFELYYGCKATAEDEHETFAEKLLMATDWEKVELEERIGGLKFAIECLDEAWKKRKDVSV